jgi:hypothetical protein
MLAQAKNDNVISCLLLSLAELTALLASSLSPAEQGACRELVSYIISRRLKVRWVGSTELLLYGMLLKCLWPICCMLAQPHVAVTGLWTADRQAFASGCPPPSLRWASNSTSQDSPSGHIHPCRHCTFTSVQIPNQKRMLRLSC